MSISVLTLNILHDHGPWPERVKLIRQWIERLDPDLIGFQEVLRGPGIDQAAELLEGSGYHLDYVAGSDSWLGRDIAFGNAIGSRWPLRSRDELRLPGTPDESRAALSVEVDAPVGPILFTSTHLHWRFHHGVFRERQVVALCERILALRQRGGFPPILVGDFNAEPDSAEIRYVRGLQSLEGRSVHFRDAWNEAGDPGPGFTWSRANPYTHAWHEPDRRIDYVFVGPPRDTGVGRVEHCRIVCDAGDGDAWPSDHLGVYAEIRSEPVGAS